MTTQTKPVPTTVMSTEPAAAIGTSISGVLVALFALLNAFDVGITDEMSNGITAFVLALCAVPAIGGWLTRFFVYAPATTQALVNDAARTGEAADVAPPPPTKGTDPMNPPPPPMPDVPWKIQRRDGSTV